MLITRESINSVFDTHWQCAERVSVLGSSNGTSIIIELYPERSFKFQIQIGGYALPEFNKPKTIDELLNLMSALNITPFRVNNENKRTTMV